MRGKRAKTLRTKDRPHPGRKHGGSMKEQAKATDERVRGKRAIRKALEDVFKPKEDPQ